ncbi:hypothetical protein PRK78_005296 [Emydomyces testavorans]|uniref:Uncharacterized protein n=1 Tax=Emydomyces testavorans TaxID=2070801 RepID=A0AAF0IKK7_9EURO|nr:hypothetical protein PRK78_005296 [Emydomyces testavorans]
MSSLKSQEIVNVREGAQSFMGSQTVPSPLYSNLHQSQKPHLLDWQLVNATSRHFRKLGKQVFFSSKTFFMHPDFADKLQKIQAEPLSTEDQQIAVACIQSIIFIQIDLLSPRWLLALPRQISIFPCLRRLDLMFYVLPDYRSEPGKLLDYISARKHLVSPFLDLLGSIGVPTDRVELGMMVAANRPWERLEDYLKDSMYPMLKAVGEIMARMKARQ